MTNNGPLQGITVIELAGIGPAPQCCMLLSDLGATVIRIEPPGGRATLNSLPTNILNRGRKHIVVDLKKPGASEIILKLCETADGLVEGFRPGVTEKLGIGPDTCMARNPKLVYGRMTGWGQTGPLAKAAGHDINYIALAGVLHAIGPKDSKPVPPLNLIGDFGGGGIFMAFGMVSGILQAKMTGKGNVIDCAMVDGAAAQLSMMYGLMQAGAWNDQQRGSNYLDGGAPHYSTYACSDGKYVAIGSLEPQFYTVLTTLLTTKGGMKNEPVMDPSKQNLRGNWDDAKKTLEDIFKTKTRDEWCAIMEGTDVCFAPVLTMSEAFEHPHAKARNAFVEIDGVKQPAPAPRFSNTPSDTPHPPPVPGADTMNILESIGLSGAQINAYLVSGTIVDGATAKL